jgi:CP family cyanate transporter-like MFS transporter
MARLPLPSPGDGRGHGVATRDGFWRRNASMICGTVLVAANLRFAIASVGPLIDDLRRDLDLSSAAAGLLTAAPLLALGLVAPAAPRLARRFAPERIVLACLAAITAGVAIRAAGPVGLLFAGTVIAGCGIAIANVLLPGIVKQRFADRAATMMGIYAAALSAGAALATGVSVPIEHAADGSWTVALGAWAIPAVVAAVVWLPQLTAGRAFASPGGRPRVTLWRDRIAWQVTTLMGLQSLLFYVVVAWLPDILHHSGVSTASAGLLSAAGLVVGIVASPWLTSVAGARADQRGVLAVAIGAIAAGLAGILLSPATATPVWVVLLGFGQGGIFALTLTLVVLRSPDAAHAAQLSSMSQSVGYTLAATGPLVVGALHDLTGSWTVPLLVCLALIVPMSAAGLAAARPGFVGEDRTPRRTEPMGPGRPAL